MGDQLVERVAAWQGLEWLSAGFSQRFGGMSEGFGKASEGGLLNLNFVPQDDPAHVEENRRRLIRGVDGADWELVVARQVHGVTVREVNRSNLREAMQFGRGQWEADGLMTMEAGLLLGTASADCVPMLVADLKRRTVGALHAGWRGTAAGMARRGLERMREAFATRPEDCVAAIGPSIGGCCYTVGEEVRSAFNEGSAFAAGDHPGTWRLNLPAANRRQLEEAGLPAAAITEVGECTACSRDQKGRRRYFSHRGEAGVTGRMLGVIGVRSEKGSI